MVGKGGLEPPRPCGHWHLKPARLPFRHLPVTATNKITTQVKHRIGEVTSTTSGRNVSGGPGCDHSEDPALGCEPVAQDFVDALICPPGPTSRHTRQMSVRTWWETKHLPRLMDKALGNEIANEWRAITCAPAEGDVVELGFGSGLNARYYGPATRRVLAVEPADLAWSLAQRRIDKAGLDVQRIGLDGAVLDLDDASADTVVSTWTLCTIPDLSGALREVRRVLRPGGTLRFTEHGLSAEPPIARSQRRLQPLWGRVSGGCHLTRDIPALLCGAGFAVTIERQEFAMPGKVSRPFSWYSSGYAVRQ